MYMSLKNHLQFLFYCFLVKPIFHQAATLLSVFSVKSCVIQAGRVVVGKTSMAETFCKEKAVELELNIYLFFIFSLSP